jgi:hypothetical protein
MALASPPDGQMSVLLPEVLMAQLPDLQIDQNIATQDSVVKNKVNTKVLFIKGEPFLSGLK